MTYSVLVELILTCSGYHLHPSDIRRGKPLNKTQIWNGKKNQLLWCDHWGWSQQLLMELKGRSNDSWHFYWAEKDSKSADTSWPLIRGSNLKEKCNFFMRFIEAAGDWERAGLSEDNMKSYEHLSWTAFTCLLETNTNNEVEWKATFHSW